jgi:hypothetical protein
MIDKKTLCIVAVAFVIGMYMTGSGRSDGPAPQPAPRRPVLQWISRTARTLLWVALLTEPPPAEKNYVVHARVDDEGRPMLDHGRGW